MKNILNIIRHDLKKISGSVVAIVTIMGLCLVPCSYAWFNILSNWAPYESEATGRISVAVANMDEGASAAGLKINVGEKIVEGLAANDDPRQSGSRREWRCRSPQVPATRAAAAGHAATGGQTAERCNCAPLAPRPSRARD